ncbi:MAG TPA: TonB-dependent receptor [Bryobacteraceae bacterium]|nr:TonB-dependent receptor [Bryobacteraceae bacterium]
MNRLSQAAIAIFALVLLTAVPMPAQTFGQITGQISDSSGAVVPDAAIALRNVNTDAVRRTVSTPSGDYTFPSLPPGTYSIQVEKQGFKRSESDNIIVQVQQTVRLDLALTIGQVSESVVVDASTVTLQSENASVGTVVENKRIVELPLNGRNFLQLVALAPNVTTLSPSAGQAGARQGGDRASQSISVAGQRTMFDYFSLDGVNNTDPNFNTYVVLPSIDALQEFKVQTGVYPAEFGHNATQINVLTKSGGNQYHGALFEFLRNEVLDAKPYSFTSRPQNKNPFKWNQYGFELDGPVRIPKLFNGKDKLFFLANYEAFRQRQNTQGVFNVPTAAMFNGDFSGLGKVIYDPNGKTPFPGNVIPQNRIDPISKKLLQYYTPANVPTATLANNYVRSGASPINKDQFIVRMDYVESAKSQWSGRYSWGDENQATQGLALDGSKILTNFEQYMGSNTRTFSPNIVNEARYGYTRFFNSIGTLLAFQTDAVSTIGIPGLQAGQPVQWGIPNVTLANYQRLGDDTEGPYANDNNTLQFVDNLSIIRGKHTFRLGGEFRRENYNQVGNQFARGQFTFQANGTLSAGGTGGDSFADFLLGDLYQSEAAVAIANATFQRNAWAFYVDDAWKVTSKLTLSLGLRYELTPPFYDTLNNAFSVYIPFMDTTANVRDLSRYPQFVRQAPCTDPYAGIAVRWPQINTNCSGRLGSRLVQTDYSDLGPRIGIAYSPSSKWVVRTGAGMFFNQDTGNPRFDMARNTAGRIRVNSAIGNPTLFWSNALASISGGTANITVPYAFANKYERRTPYTWEYLLNVQRELPHEFVVEAGYLGSISRKLEFLRAVNESVPGTVGTVQMRSPYPNFGRIQLVDPAANGVYNSGSIKLTKRFSSGFSLLTSYTYARSLDNSSGIRVQGQDTLFPQNSNCRKCEWGLSAFDTRHRFATSSLWDIPVGRGRKVDVQNGFLNTLAGGWQAGFIWTVQTGFPQTVTIGGIDRSGAGGLFDRPNATGVSPYLDNPTPTRWYNPAAFALQPAGTFGNLGRNTVIGPGIFALDFSAHKEFRMPYSEQHRLQFRFEGFNILNHPVWSPPNINTQASAFGSVTGTAIAMRQLQMALKYLF